ncbi:MAG: glycosyltransferase family 39 protein [Gemmatimonadaceae bacterium]
MVALVALAAVPRAVELDRFATPDEPRWLSRSANFYQALSAGDLASTFQAEHPGVPVMWAGALAFIWKFPDYVRQGAGQVNPAAEGVEPVIRGAGHSPADMLEAARQVLLVLHLLVLTGVLYFAARLLGAPAAMAAFVMVALDPYHVALSRVLHLDALQSAFMLLSVLALASHLQGGRRWELIVSGAAAGLAVLTKTPAAFLLPFAAALVAVHAWLQRAPERSDAWQQVRQGVTTMVIWGASAMGVGLIIWPGLWASPLHIPQEILTDMTQHATESVANPAFFMGRITTDQGPLYYPVTYAWVVTPVMLAGLGVAMLAAVRRWSPLDGATARRGALVLAAFALLFGLTLIAMGSKSTRYLLPAHLALLLVAGVGWLALLRYLWRSGGARARTVAAVLAVVALIVQGADLVRTVPYYFTYANPLLGGPAAVRAVRSVGWGEGLDQAARYLDSLPDAERLTVASWYGYGSFSYFFRGRTVSVGAFWNDSVAARVADSDYLVVYYHQLQRGLPSAALLASLEREEPVHVVRIGGLEYARIYRMAGTNLPTAVQGAPANQPVARRDDAP